MATGQRSKNKFQIIQVILLYSRYTQTFYPFRIKVQRDHLLQPSCYLGGGPSAGPSRRLPGPLLGDAVDIVAPPSGRVRVLLPKVNDLERLLTGGGRAGRLRLRQTLLWLHFGVKWGVLPGQLGQVRLCRHLGGKNLIKGENVELERRTRGERVTMRKWLLRAD